MHVVVDTGAEAAARFANVSGLHKLRALSRRY